jgi:adenosylmethionine-8-amino-7-oxononanoate aminotransferase
MSVIQNRFGATLPHIVRGQGVWLVDDAGNRYLDGCSGAVVASIGHGHPDVLRAIGEQAARVTYVHRGFFADHSLDELARRLTAWTGYAGAWFVNSGSEAVEAALQFACQYHRERGRPQRQEFLSLTRGYHGNTLGGLSLSGHARRAVVGDLAWPFAELPVPYRPPGADPRPEEEFTRELLATTRRLVEQRADRLAGVVLEPVGGATLGATVPPAGYLHGMRELCDEHGLLLITDEVMCGLGRAGPPLAAQHWGVRADLVAVGKGLGAGYTPIAATLVSGRVLDAIGAGSGAILGGHTYAGNPLSAATALAVLTVLQSADVVAAGARGAIRLRRGLDALAGRHDLISEVRGQGMLLGIELTAPVGADRPAPGLLAERLREHAMAAGLLIYPATGGFLDAVLIAPPLTSTDDEVDELIKRLDRALTACAELPAGRVGARRGGTPDE